MNASGHELWHEAKLRMMKESEQLRAVLLASTHTDSKHSKPHLALREEDIGLWVIEEKNKLMNDLKEPGEITAHRSHGGWGVGVFQTFLMEMFSVLF